MIATTFTLAFKLVFGFFVVAIAVWASLTARWAMRRDRQRRLSQRDGSMKE
jgi:membrane protein implicated in regulation of membrane protease activity